MQCIIKNNFIIYIIVKKYLTAQILILKLLRT